MTDDHEGQTSDGTTWPYFDMAKFATVKASDGSSWTVRLMQARVPDYIRPWRFQGQGGAYLGVALRACLKRLPYWLRIRKGWKVLIYPGEVLPQLYSSSPDPPPEAVVDERYPSWELALARALELLRIVSNSNHGLPNGELE